jgi:hypothetical protein
VLDRIVCRGDLTFLKSRHVPLLAPHFEPLKRFVVMERIVVLLFSFGVQLAFVPLSLWCEVRIDTKNKGRGRARYLSAVGPLIPAVNTLAIRNR